MLKIFNLENSRLNYHQKIIKKIQSNLAFLPESFWKTNPIISGSYAVCLLFKPLASYDDIDFYFETKKDFLACNKILKELNTTKASLEAATKIYSAKNSITYVYGFVKIQLINKAFKPPQELIYDHDLKNVSIAIKGSTIYLDDEVFKLFYDDKISIRSTQVTDDMCDKTKMIKIANLYNRIRKYMSRYDLTLDQHSKEIIEELINFLATHPETLKASILVNDMNIYYGFSYNDTQAYKVSILEIEKSMMRTITDTFALEFPHQNEPLNLDTLPF